MSYYSGTDIEILIRTMQENKNMTNLSISFSDIEEYFENNTLFAKKDIPLLVKLDNGLLLVNGDVDNNIDPEIQDYCLDAADLIIPFSALQHIITNKGKSIGYENLVSGNKFLNKLEILESEDERYDIVGYSLCKTMQYDGWKNKKRITLQEYIKLDPDQKNKCVSIEERRPQSDLLKYDKKYYLSAMDGEGYFIVQLPKKVDSIRKAFNLLKPPQFKTMTEKDGYKRQGEWFLYDITEFVQGNKREEYRKLDAKYILPKKDEESNSHMATRGGMAFELNLSDDVPKWVKVNTPVISGTLKHPEHMSTFMSYCRSPKFYACFENTAVVSYSAKGRVD